jgi:hypothetical protein
VQRHQILLDTRTENLLKKGTERDGISDSEAIRRALTSYYEDLEPERDVYSLIAMFIGRYSNMEKIDKNKD